MIIFIFKIAMEQSHERVTTCTWQFFAKRKVGMATESLHTFNGILNQTSAKCEKN